MNKVLLLGRLTDNPKAIQTESGVAMCSFTLAVRRPFSKDADNNTDFIRCTAFRQSAEFMLKYMTKGRMTCVEGSIRNRKWKDKEGKEQWSTEVEVSNVEAADSRKDSGFSRADEPPMDTYLAQAQNYTSGININRAEDRNYSSVGNINIPNIDFEDDEDLPF